MVFTYDGEVVEDAYDLSTVRATQISWQGHLHGSRKPLGYYNASQPNPSLRGEQTFLCKVSIMAQFGRYRFLLVAVVFHLVYIYSIFSIYFVSPVVHGMREHHVETQEAPAKRLVLFVG